MLYNVVLVSGVQHSDSVIHIHIFFFFRFFSHIGHYRILSSVPCAVQEVLVGYLFYIFYREFGHQFGAHFLSTTESSGHPPASGKPVPSGP